MYWFNSINRKVLFGFTLVILFVLMQGIYNFYKVKQIDSTIHNVVDRQLTFVLGNDAIRFSIPNQILAARHYVWEGNHASDKERFEMLSEQSEEAEAEILKRSSSEEVRQQIEDVVTWRDALESEVFDTFDRGDKDQAAENLAKLEEQGFTHMSIFEKLTEDRQNDITASGEDVLNNTSAAITMTIIVSIIVIVLSIIVAQVTARPIANGVKKVMHQMKFLARGDLSQEPLEARSNDEIGQLIQAINEMAENNRMLLQEITTVSERVSSQSEELTQSANEVKAGADQVARTMQELSDGAETQAHKANSIMEATGSFTEKMEEAAKYGSEIQHVSTEVLDMTQEGSRLMTSSTKQMTKIDAIVHDAVKKVEGLDEHSQEISNLVGVIRDIAEKTNLLALNAAIEAARAGEHGQGFSIVADEVRKLAEQVEVSVTDITSIVTNIQEESKYVTQSLHEGYKEVEEGTSSIRVTGETFNEINKKVTEMANQTLTIYEHVGSMEGQNEDMSKDIEEISAILQESAAGIEETSVSSRQTSGSMEEIAGSSNDLAQLAEKLNSLVRRFKL